MPSSQPIDIPDAKKRNKKKKRCRATDSFSGRFEGKSFYYQYNYVAGQTCLLKWVRLRQSSILTCHTLYSRCLQTARRGIGRRCLCQSANMHQPHNEQGICCQGRRMFFRAWSINVLFENICCPSSCSWVFHHITFVWWRQTGVALASCSRLRRQPLSCPVMLAFFEPCALCTACLQVLFVLLLLCSVLFLPAELDIVSRARPSLLSFCGSLSESRKEWIHPSVLLILPRGGASGEDTVYPRLCQNKNPQRGRRGAGRVMSGCLHCFVLRTVTLFLLFLSKLGVGLTTYLNFLELPFLFKYKKHIFAFLRKKKKIMNYSVLNCSKVQWGLVL